MVKKGKRKSGKPAIVGIVIPAKWDENGNVIGVTIHTDDEKVYFVEHTRTGEELLGLIHRKVEATGKIRERLDGSTLINVQKYKAIQANFNIKAASA